MKKLSILKSLVDFIWIVTCLPLIPILLFFSVFIFVNPESLNVIFEMNDDIVTASPPIFQVFGLLFAAMLFLGIYCFYLFRKTLRYFQRIKPFHEKVIENFHKIGRLLSIIGISGSILFFVARVILKNEIKINLGISPYLTTLCLGLFFMVLSEIFKIAKQAKEENELTV